MNKQFIAAFRNTDPSINGGRRTVSFGIQTHDELDSLAKQHGAENLLYIKGPEYVKT